MRTGCRPCQPAGRLGRRQSRGPPLRQPGRTLFSRGQVQFPKSSSSQESKGYFDIQPATNEAILEPAIDDVNMAITKRIVQIVLAHFSCISQSFCDLIRSYRFTKTSLDYRKSSAILRFCIQRPEDEMPASPLRHDRRPCGPGFPCVQQLIHRRCFFTPTSLLHTS